MKQHAVPIVELRRRAKVVVSPANEALGKLNLYAELLEGIHDNAIDLDEEAESNNPRAGVVDDVESILSDIV